MLCKQIESGIDVRQFVNELDFVINVLQIQYGNNLWDLDTRRQDKIKFHKHTKIIKLRVPDVSTESQANTLETKDAQFYPNMWTKTKAFLDGFNERNNCQTMSASYVKLYANMTIAAHRDLGKYYEAYNRYHFVLSGTYRMIVDGWDYTYKPGCVYWFDNIKEHSVINGNEDRIALIFDTKPCERKL